MAFVDFTNAQLHLPSKSSFNITIDGYASIYNGNLVSSSGQTISTNSGVQLLINESNKLVFQYTGTFTASGTEFYFGAKGSVNEKYKMTDISFQSGDNYSFQVTINLTCFNNQLVDVPEDELISTGD